MESSLNNESFVNKSEINYDSLVENTDMTQISKTYDFQSSIFIEEEMQF